MRINKLETGTDFIPTMNREGPNDGFYVKARLDNASCGTYLVYSIKGTQDYCIQTDKGIFILNNYCPHRKFYRLYTGHYVINKSDEEPVLPYDGYKDAFSFKGSKSKGKLWFRFVKDGLPISPDRPSELKFVSQESIDKGKLLFEPDPGLLLMNEQIETYSKQELIATESEHGFYLRSLSTFEQGYPLRIISKDQKGRANELIIQSPNGSYLLHGVRVDYVKHFAGDYYVSSAVSDELGIEKLTTYGMSRVALQEVSVLGCTPITYYELTTQARAMRIGASIALVGLLASTLWIPYTFRLFL